MTQYSAMRTQKSPLIVESTGLNGGIDGICSEERSDDKTGRVAGRTTAGEEPPAQRNVWALGLEPRTVGLENRCSIQLSYTHNKFYVRCRFEAVKPLS